ncbi:MAG: imidazole glycerol phosphate synthase subunit HisF [Chloroflexi bacterium HGW-Chloroflexi-3]|nr:MAG: imidazole glycerol phosphate synthase subunit HisF [Chloroflexi bacterium HGW-Chloroflexi-3]
MLAKRIIPCLDIKDGRVVKGINFVNIRDAGDPVDQARVYNEEGADELVFLDISATAFGHETVVHVVREVANQIHIPLTVGGGIRSVEDMRKILLAGADKISINSAAVLNPEIIKQGCALFGSQCIVLAVDARKTQTEDAVTNKWEVFINGGRKPTGIDVLEWIKQAVDLGAGEILLTSMDRDGTHSGYDLELNQAVSELVNVPLIASGGAGAMQHFADVLSIGADAALAASLFHDGQMKIRELKQYLAKLNLPIRLA